MIYAKRDTNSFEACDCAFEPPVKYLNAKNENDLLILGRKIVLEQRKFIRFPDSLRARVTTSRNSVLWYVGEKKEVDVARSINPLSIIALGGQIHSCSLTCPHNELPSMTGNNTAICLQVARRKRNTHATVKHDLSRH